MVLTISHHHLEEVLKAHLPLARSQHRRAQLVAGLDVGRVGGEAGGGLVAVDALGCSQEADAGQQSARPGIAREGRDRLLGAGQIAELEECSGEPEGGGRVLRPEEERRLEVGAGECRFTALECAIALLGEPIRVTGREPLEELAHRRLRPGAHELGDHLAVAECLDGRDAADLVAAGHLGVGVDIDLDQLHAAREVGGDALEDGADDPAGTAPGGPEVDDHGDLV